MPGLRAGSRYLVVGAPSRCPSPNWDLRRPPPVLKKYVEPVPITRPYFEAEPEVPVEAFAAAAARHPVFRICEVLVPVCRAATVSGP